MELLSPRRRSIMEHARGGAGYVHALMRAEMGNVPCQT